MKLPAQSYGYMTHSWLKSAEHRQTEKERHKYTMAWQSQVHQAVLVLPACTCRYKPFPHVSHAELERLRDWRPRQ